MANSQNSNESDNNVKKIEESSLIKAIVVSIFDAEGPTPKYYYPEDLDENSRLLIAMKTISLLMGEATYQDGNAIEGVNYFGILPFPDIKLNGLTYFFLIFDPEARGQAKAATITILVDEENKSFFYDNIKYLRVIIDKSASQIQNAKDSNEMKNILDSLRMQLLNFIKDLKHPFSQTRQIKILFAGLDRSGKSSFVLGIEKKYSEIIKVLPTKGVSREISELFGAQLIRWELGGQKSYRDQYLKESEVYLYNVDLLFFLIDVQDLKRREEGLKYFKRLIESLENIDDYPPIVLCFHKTDPDIKNDKRIRENIEFIIMSIQEFTQNYYIKIFETSIFDHWSLVSAFSYGISRLSPNREIFRKQLEWFANKTDSEAILLLNEKAIILSNFSRDDVSGKVFEISAPHFQTLYKTFKEFKILKKDFLVSSGISQTKKILFKKLNIEKFNLYLLLFISSEDFIERIDEYLDEFISRIEILIQTYI